MGGAFSHILGPKLLLAMGCMKLGEKIAFSCLLWVNKPQINHPISRNPWEVIISSPVCSPKARRVAAPRQMSLITAAIKRLEARGRGNAFKMTTVG